MRMHRFKGFRAAFLALFAVFTIPVGAGAQQTAFCAASDGTRFNVSLGNNPGSLASAPDISEIPAIDDLSSFSNVVGVTQAGAAQLGISLALNAQGTGQSLGPCNGTTVVPGIPGCIGFSFSVQESSGAFLVEAFASASDNRSFTLTCSPAVRTLSRVTVFRTIVRNSFSRTGFGDIPILEVGQTGPLVGEDRPGFPYLVAPEVSILSGGLGLRPRLEASTFPPPRDGFPRVREDKLAGRVDDSTLLDRLRQIGTSPGTSAFEVALDTPLRGGVSGVTVDDIIQQTDPFQIRP